MMMTRLNLNKLILINMELGSLYPSVSISLRGRIPGSVKEIKFKKITVVIIEHKNSIGKAGEEIHASCSTNTQYVIIMPRSMT